MDVKAAGARRTLPKRERAYVAIKSVPLAVAEEPRSYPGHITRLIEQLGDLGKFPCAGVYAVVAASGPIKIGDQVVLSFNGADAKLLADDQTADTTLT